MSLFKAVFSVNQGEASKEGTNAVVEEEDLENGEEGTALNPTTKTRTDSAS